MKKSFIAAKLNQKGSKWFVYYSVPDETGKMKRVKTYFLRKGVAGETHSEKIKAANTLIEEINLKLERGWNPLLKKSPVVSNLIPDIQHTPETDHAHNIIAVIDKIYLQNLSSTLSPNSKVAYKCQIRNFFKYLIETKQNSLDIRDFEYADCQKFLDYLTETRNFKGKSRNDCRFVLKMIFQNAVKVKIINENPWAGCKKVKESMTPAPYFKDDLKKLVSDYCRDNCPELYFFHQFIYFCFIRPAEIRLLKIRDINLKDGRITIPGLISKNRKTQTVDMPVQFQETLLRQGLQNLDENLYVFGKNGWGGEKPVDRSYFRLKWKKVREILGIPSEYKNYGMKHTGAINAVKAGINLKELKEQLRHHSLDMVDTYITQLRGNESEAIRNKFPSF